MLDRRSSTADDALLPALLQATERLIVLVRADGMRVRNAVQYVRGERETSSSCFDYRDWNTTERVGRKTTNLYESRRALQEPYTSTHTDARAHTQREGSVFASVVRAAMEYIF